MLAGPFCPLSPGSPRMLTREVRAAGAAQRQQPHPQGMGRLGRSSKQARSQLTLICSGPSKALVLWCSGELLFRMSW